jgi:hypothetical protein
MELDGQIRKIVTGHTAVTIDIVVAGAAVKRVGLTVAKNQVVAFFAVYVVSAVELTSQLVGCEVASQFIIARAAIQHIGHAVSHQHVIAFAPIQIVGPVVNAG